uniref:Uncharacterized protein n=1 Tax=Oryza rufipogon TaxID=4529 RepID=A0A0E0NR23_ORYRU
MSASPRHKDTRRRRWMPTGRPAASTITTSTTNIISTRRSRRRRWMPTGRPLASTTTTSTTNTISTRRRRRRRWGTRGRTRTLLRHSRTDTRRRRCTRRRTRSRRRLRRTGTSAPRSARDGGTQLQHPRGPLLLLPPGRMLLTTRRDDRITECKALLKWRARRESTRRRTWMVLSTSSQARLWLGSTLE